MLDRIGAGGMAVVFKGEHIHLRHLVAIKVLPLSPGYDKKLLTRFFAEMRVVAQLRHPNIVTAIDAGKTVSDNPDDPELRYFVMDYVPGQDLEEYIQTRGPLAPAKACNLAHQIASALAETHKFNLVHRDIKPSNILITNEDQAKLLDFGLTRNFNARHTQPGTVLGTLDYMAPEQAHDASTVDIRADLYGLGGTLFWCLTGKLPFPPTGSPTETLIRRLSQPPPSARKHVPTLPVELDALLTRLLATNPEDRYRTPQAVMLALLPFLKGDSGMFLPGRRPMERSARAGCSRPGCPAITVSWARARRVGWCRERRRKGRPRSSLWTMRHACAFTAGRCWSRMRSSAMRPPTAPRPWRPCWPGPTISSCSIAGCRC